MYTGLGLQLHMTAAHARVLQARYLPTLLMCTEVKYGGHITRQVSKTDLLT